MTERSIACDAGPDVGEVWAVLANSDRRAIVQALAVDRLRGGVGLSVNQLATDVGLTRFATSRHLKLMRAAGVVDSSKAGATLLHRLDPARILLAEDWLINVLGC